jgi:hypothetical protein
MAEFQPGFAALSRIVEWVQQFETKTNRGVVKECPVVRSRPRVLWLTVVSACKPGRSNHEMIDVPARPAG